MSTRRFARVLLASACLLLSLSLLPIDSLTQDVEAQRRRGRSRARIGTYGHFYHPYYGFYYGLYHGYPYGYGTQGGYLVRSNGGSGIRLLVEPKDAEVYIDGYFAGWVDDFDGFFQRLRVPAGEHEIILYHEGYQTDRQMLFLNAGGTFKVRHEMVPLAAGEQAGPRPEPPEDEFDIEEREPDMASAPPRRTIAPPRRPSPQRRGRSQSGRFGVLVVRVSPGDAEIHIDGDLWPSVGTDDLDDLVKVHLPVGKHRVEIQRAGHESFSTEINIRSGDETRLNVKLPRIGGSA